MAGNFFINNSNEASIMNLLKAFQQNLLSNLHCIKLGYIDSYDYDTRVSRVIIYNKYVAAVNNKGEHITQDYPPLYCKTLFLGGLNCGMTWDIQQGDECIVFFADREIESLWLSGQISDLKYYRMHNYTDAICLTGFRTLPKTTATNKKMVLYNQFGEINLDSKNNIKISSDTEIILDAPTVSTTGNLSVGTGISTMVPCGSSTLVFTNGILTGVE